MSTGVEWTIPFRCGTLRALRHVACKVLSAVSAMVHRLCRAVVASGWSHATVGRRQWRAKAQMRRDVHLGVNVDHLSDPS